MKNKSANLDAYNNNRFCDFIDETSKNIFNVCLTETRKHGLPDQMSFQLMGSLIQGLFGHTATKINEEIYRKTWKKMVVESIDLMSNYIESHAKK